MAATRAVSLEASVASRANSAMAAGTWARSASRTSTVASSAGTGLRRAVRLTTMATSGRKKPGVFERAPGVSCISAVNKDRTYQPPKVKRLLRSSCSIPVRRVRLVQHGLELVEMGVGHGLVVAPALGGLLGDIVAQD